MEQQHVIFELGNDLYGVHIADVESIVKTQEMTAMPQSPAYIDGVTNLRGKIVPVVNLRKRLGLPAVAATKETRIMVISSGDSQIGMVVDAVSEVLTVADSAVEPPPELTITDGSTFVKGIAKTRVADGNSRLVVLLDLQRVLTPEEQLALSVE